VWQNPSVDEGLGLVYFGTGNAAPDINGHLRAGDNHFASSTVALDLATGKLSWFFQETHHDLWDYDSTMTTVLRANFPGARSKSPDPSGVAESVSDAAGFLCRAIDSA
jgi:glucose dehydrogenase